MEPGAFRTLDELVRRETKGRGNVELLELRHQADEGGGDLHCDPIAESLEQSPRAGSSALNEDAQ